MITEEQRGKASRPQGAANNPETPKPRGLAPDSRRARDNSRYYLIWLVMMWSFMLPRVSPAGTLFGSYAVVPTGSTVNLTAEGALDWVHWAMNTEYGYDRKSAVPALIGSLVPIYGMSGSGPYQYWDNYNAYSWTDGEPNTFATNTSTFETNTTTGLFILSRLSGFQLTVPADTVRRRLKVYVGAYRAQGQLDAALSDNSAAAYSDSSLANDSNGPCSVYTLDYAANSAGQTLTVTFIVKRPLDNSQLNNVTLQAAALSYVLANNPPTATLIAPAANTVFLAPTNLPLSAVAADSDGTISKVEFFAGSTKLGESTGAAYSFVWTNAPAGDHLLQAVATDDAGLSYTSRPVEIFINTNGGFLSGSVEGVRSEVDLTADGNLDWAHWGLSSSSGFDHKSGVAQQISNFIQVGPNGAQGPNGYSTFFDWSDGTPTTFGGTASGVFITGLGNGFELTVPAVTSTRTLKLYVGLYAAQGNLQAFLSNFSAPAYVDSSLSSFYDDAYGVYTFNFSSTTPNQTLHVRFTSQSLFDQAFGNVTLEAASLSGLGAAQPITLVNPKWNHGTFTFSFNAESNRTYNVEYKDALSTGPWQMLTDVTGTGTAISISNTPPIFEKRFYRVWTQ